MEIVWINGRGIAANTPHTHGEAPSSQEECDACVVETALYRRWLHTQPLGA